MNCNCFGKHHIECNPDIELNYVIYTYGGLDFGLIDKSNPQYSFLISQVDDEGNGAEIIGEFITSDYNFARECFKNAIENYRKVKK